jgi:tripeptidyl-peptidase-1
VPGACSTNGSSPTNPANEPFLEWLQTVDGLPNPPLVFSVSYGDDEQSVGYAYAVRINQEFVKQGARGISVLFAAGDDGTGGNCTRDDHFTPDFPSGSPW